MRKIILISFVLALTAAGCSKNTVSEKNFNPASDRLADQLARTGNESSVVEYLAIFQSEEDAVRHADDANREHGLVSFLEGSRRVQKIKIARASLGDVEIPEDAALSLNTVVRTEPRANSGEEEPLDPKMAARDLLTARKVVGVDKLRERFPSADGRNATVAVFDSGIDFGVPGLEKDREGNQKLLGFYDLSGFGLVEGELLADSTPQTNYEIAGKKLFVSLNLEAEKITAVGSFSEAELARKYLSTKKSVDLNGDGDADDSYLFVMGTNKEKAGAVWIDTNNDGQLDRRDLEEFTDYNSTRVARPLAQVDGSPNGARPLAISNIKTNAFQLHSVHSGHGTACATIVAGDGYAGGLLDGMAPKAKLLSYTLDVTGQDVYTLDQFLQMFLHARDLGASVISISWGFTTADLESARFVADFLDTEIAAKGVVIAIAAGNSGPTFSSSVANDYMPHHGLSVGAMVSKEQALNVYGLIGVEKDLVVDYSGFGLSAGGRENPDIVSPLMTLVRGHRAAKAPNFYPFSGTSSATPALAGAVATLVSTLKEQGMEIDARLLKLALLNSAVPLLERVAVKQGAGVLNVNAAYDLYLKLVAEWKKASPSVAMPFPYELRTNVFLPGRLTYSEGIELRGFASEQPVSLALTAASVAKLDKLEFTDSLTLEHSGSFFETPKVVLLQSTGASFTVAFDSSKLATPGIYSDVILVKRSDGLVLARVPVVVHIPLTVSEDRTIVRMQESLPIFNTWSKPVRLHAPARIAFTGVLQDSSGSPSRFTFMIKNAQDNEVFSSRPKMGGAVTAVQWETPLLPAGQYEIVAVASKRGPAKVGNIEVSGYYHLPDLNLLAKQSGEKTVTTVLRSETATKWTKAFLTVDKLTQAHSLTLGEFEGRKAFMTTVDLPHEVSALDLTLSQSDVDSLVDRMLHMELVLINAEKNEVVYRGWSELKRSVRDPLSLSTPAKKFVVVAYPNIGKWEKISTARLALDLAFALPTSVRSELDLGNSFSTFIGQVFPLHFPLADGISLPEAGFTGKVELQNSDGAKVPVSF